MIKNIPILALLLLVLSLECGLSYVEASDRMAPRARPARQSSYCNYAYSNCYSSSYSSYAGAASSTISAGAYIGVSIVCFVVFCLPCIIVGIVICCCLCIPGCILSTQRNHGVSNQVMTTTTVTQPKYEQPTVYPQYPQAQGYPQPGYPPQGYAPPQQGYYPQTAPAQPYSNQADIPTKYEGGYDPTAHPGYTAYPTDQAPPSYTSAAQGLPPAQYEPQTHGIGFQT